MNCWIGLVYWVTNLYYIAIFYGSGSGRNQPEVVRGLKDCVKFPKQSYNLLWVIIKINNRDFSFQTLNPNFTFKVPI